MVEAASLGLLILVMLLGSPVSHLHYFSLAVPLVMGLVALEAETPHPSVLHLWVVAVIFLTTTTLPFLPGLEALRSLGLAMYGALLLCLSGVIALSRIVRRAQSERPNNGGETRAISAPVGATA